MLSIIHILYSLIFFWCHLNRWGLFRSLRNYHPRSCRKDFFAGNSKCSAGLGSFERVPRNYCRLYVRSRELALVLCHYAAMCFVYGANIAFERLVIYETGGRTLLHRQPARRGAWPPKLISTNRLHRCNYLVRLTAPMGGKSIYATTEIRMSTSLSLLLNPNEIISEH